MRTWHQWSWITDPEAPLSWPDPEKRIVLVAPECSDDLALIQRMQRAMTLAAERGCTFVTAPAPAYFPFWNHHPNVIPALLVRRQADLYGVHALNRVRSQHKALLIEPEESLDLNSLVCPDCGRLDEVTADDGTPYCTECDEVEMCGDAILDPLNDGVDLGIVRGREKPLHPDVVRSLRDQCQAAGVAFHFAGWGDWTPDTQTVCAYEDMALFNKRENGDEPVYLRDLEENRREDWAYWHNADDVFMYRVGPERSGRMLDGREWLDTPEGI